MPPSTDYLLGNSAQEWERLEEQHALWGPILLAQLERLGLTPGHRVLEVGCGTGALLEDLAKAVGPEGTAVGLEIDEATAHHATRRLGARAQVRHGDLMGDDLGGSYDIIVARWVFSFLPNPAAAVARLRDSLTPGGVLVVQDYNHDALGVWPMDPLIERVIGAYRAAYTAKGGDLWVACQLPELFLGAGLTEMQIWPEVMAGQPGSPPWRWVERFVLEHLPTLVESGHLTEPGAQETRDAWAKVAKTPGAILFTPHIVTVSGRKP